MIDVSILFVETSISCPRLGVMSMMLVCGCAGCVIIVAMSNASGGWLSGDQQRVWRRWLSTHVDINSATARQLAADNELSLPEYQVMVVLSEAEDRRMRMAALADSIRWDRSRLTHQINRMEKRGLVAKMVCSEDRRGAYVTLTDEGFATIRAAAPGHVEQVRSVFFEALSADEVAALGSILDKLHAHLNPDQE